MAALSASSHSASVSTSSMTMYPKHSKTKRSISVIAPGFESGNIARSIFSSPLSLYALPILTGRVLSLYGRHFDRNLPPRRRAAKDAVHDDLAVQNTLRIDRRRATRTHSVGENARLGNEVVHTHWLAVLRNLGCHVGHYPKFVAEQRQLRRQ